jgi:hypothetical protein
LIVLNKHGGHIKTEEYKLKNLKFKRCSEDISPGSNFCFRCGLPINLNIEYTLEMELEKEKGSLKLEFDAIH